MVYNKLNNKASYYMDSWGIKYDTRGMELLMSCKFSTCDEARGSKHLYMSAETGVFYCHKCGARGNLYSFASKLGLVDFSNAENYRVHRRECIHRGIAAKKYLKTVERRQDYEC